MRARGDLSALHCHVDQQQSGGPSRDPGCADERAGRQHERGEPGRVTPQFFTLTLASWSVAMPHLRRMVLSPGFGMDRLRQEIPRAVAALPLRRSARRCLIPSGERMPGYALLAGVMTIRMKGSIEVAQERGVRGARTCGDVPE